MDTIEDTLEAHLHRHSSTGSLVHLVLAAIVLCGLAALPLIRVSISVQAEGAVRPAVETHELRAPRAGIVQAISVHRAGVVEEGEELFRLREEAESFERSAILEVLEDLERTGRDLEYLARDPSAPAPPRVGPEVREEHSGYLSGRREILIRLEHARSDLQRFERLGDVVARVEVDEKAHRVSVLEAELASLDARRLAELRGRIHENRNRARELEVRLREAEAAIDRSTLRAPVAGIIEQLAAISPGSFVQAGQPIARIVPSGEMVADVWVSPKDVGLLRRGDPARLLVHAYDYREWGFLAGTIRDISPDATFVDQQPRFRVGVRLEGTELRLENGARGEIMKGMTLQARFPIGDRSLWRLLHDRVEGRFNPRYLSQ